MTQIGIIGTGAWATTLGILLARDGKKTVLWSRTEARAQELTSARVNERSVPGVEFPELVTISASLEEAIGTSDLVIIAVPSVTIRENIRKVRSAIPSGANVVCATKGIEIASGKRMSQVISEELPGFWRSQIGVLSGPNLAREIAAGNPSTATIAFPEDGIAEQVQSTLSSESFRVYRSEDVIGVELGGALKNIIAIGAAFIDGAGLGANAKAAFVTRGLHEITRLGIAMGARPETFSGQSGMGDLIATCYSNLSRNYRLGIGLASGKDLPAILEDLGETAEGAPTTQAAVRLAKELKIDMPITDATHAVLFEGTSPVEVIRNLMGRSLQPETHY